MDGALCIALDLQIKSTHIFRIQNNQSAFGSEGNANWVMKSCALCSRSLNDYECKGGNSNFIFTE